MNAGDRHHHGSGIMVALPTAFDAHAKISTAPLQQLTADLAQAGIEGFLACGSMGLGPLLENQEFEAVIAATAEALRGSSALLIAGCGMPSLPQTLRRIALAETRGAGAVCVTAPFFFKYGEAELLRYFQAILEASPLDVFIYEVPIRTGNSISPAILQQLLKYPNLRGIKVTNFDLEYLRRIAADFGSLPGVRVYNGINRHMPAALAMGYRGFIDGLFALDPHTPQALLRAHDAGQAEAVAAQHGRLIALDDFLGREGVWPAFTALLNVQGYAGQWLRAPQLAPDAALLERAARFAEQWGLGRLAPQSA